jgi:hypothetical protein
MRNAHNRKLLLATGCALAAAGAASTAVIAQDQPPAPTTIELVQRESETRSGFVDAPPRRREGPGDLFSVSGPLRDASGRRAGSASAAFVQTSRSAAQGSATFVLSSGRLAAVGSVGSGRLSRLAIVGGTGAYEGAEGTAEVITARRATRFRITLVP